MAKGSNVERRKKYWYINFSLRMVLPFTKKRDKNTWIFGCWEGNKYDDNSKYLFEYISNAHKDINAVWLSKKIEIVNEVRRAGYKSELIGTKESRCIQKKAGVAFYTNGLDDFGDVLFLHGAKIVSLWHGQGLKKIYYAGLQKGSIAYKKQEFKDRLFSWIYSDLTVSTSKSASDFFNKSLNVPFCKIAILGQPRNDVFKEKINPSHVLKNINNPDDYKYVLYMPTYRGYTDTTIKDTVESFLRDKNFLDKLNDNHIRILLKLHYLSVVNIEEENDNVFVLKDDNFSNTQELLAVSDLLISDYSSCIFDYSLTNKPIVLYSSDYNKYVSNVGLLDEWYYLYEKFSLTNIEQLKEEIASIDENKNGNELSAHLKMLCEDPSIQGTCYSENIYKAVINQLL